MNTRVHSGWYRGLTLSLTLGLLSACGGGGGSPTPTGSNAAPTRTPRPTRETETEPTRAPRPSATPVTENQTSASGLAVVRVGDLINYQHESGAFSVDVPENWDFNDNSNADELIIYWTDPADNAALQVNMFLSSRELSPNDLLSALRGFLEDNFGPNDNFGMEDPVEQSDGSQLITWSFDVTIDNVQATRLGNSFVEQRGNVVSILTTLVPQEQFDTLVQYTDKMINSYRINPDTTDFGGSGGNSGAATATDVRIDELVTIQHPSGTFTALVPDNWDEVDQSSAGELLLFWFDPSRLAAEIVSVIEDPAGYNNSQLAAHQLQHLESLFGTQPSFSVGEPEEQADGSLRVYVEFEDTDAAGATVLLYGYSYVEQRGDIVAVLTLIVPSTADDTVLAAMNEILGGYSVSATGSLD